MPKHRKSTTTKLKTLAVIGTVFVAILIVGVYRARNTNAFVDATTHQPERYTELYFSNPTAIPINVIHGKQLSVSFTTHNVEAHPMGYSYDVEFIASNNIILTQEQGDFNVPTNGTVVNTDNITVPQTYRGKAEVQVTLTNVKQTIDFWVQTR